MEEEYVAEKLYLAILLPDQIQIQLQKLPSRSGTLQAGYRRSSPLHITLLAPRSADLWTENLLTALGCYISSCQPPENLILHKLTFFEPDLVVVLTDSASGQWLERFHKGIFDSVQGLTPSCWEYDKYCPHLTLVHGAGENTVSQVQDDLGKLGILLPLVWGTVPELVLLSKGANATTYETVRKFNFFDHSGPSKSGNRRDKYKEKLELE